MELSYKYFTKSFLFLKLLPKASEIQTTIQEAALKLEGVIIDQGDLFIDPNTRIANLQLC